MCIMNIDGVNVKPSSQHKLFTEYIFERVVLKFLGMKFSVLRLLNLYQINCVCFTEIKIMKY